MWRSWRGARASGEDETAEMTPLPDNPHLRFDTTRYSVVLSLGSNLGNTEELLAWAVARARQRAEVVQVSGMYSTPPWGPVEQPDFRNVTVIATGEMTPRQWLLWGNDLEAKALRVRDQRWGPRTLDVDVIAAAFVTPDGEFQPCRSDDPDLILPHPRALQRAFVLQPWLEIEPYAWFQGRPLAEWYAELDADEKNGITRLGDVPLVDPDTAPPVNAAAPDAAEAQSGEE